MNWTIISENLEKADEAESIVNYTDLITESNKDQTRSFDIHATTTTCSNQSVKYSIESSIGRVSEISKKDARSDSFKRKMKNEEDCLLGSPENAAMIESSCRKMEVSSSKIEASSSKIKSVASKMEAASSSKMEASSSKMEASSSKMEASSSEMKSIASKMETSSSKMEATSSKMEASSKKIPVSFSKMKDRSSQMEASEKDVSRPDNQRHSQSRLDCSSSSSVPSTSAVVSKTNSDVSAMFINFI